DEVHHAGLPERRLIVPGLLGDAHTRGGELGGDVFPRLLDGHRTGRTRTDRQELTQFFPCQIRIEVRRCRARDTERRETTEKKQPQSHRDTEQKRSTRAACIAAPRPLRGAASNASVPLWLCGLFSLCA